MRSRVADAQYSVAGRYSHGSGTPQDLAEAARWHKAAAELGHPLAIDAYGQCLQKLDGMAQDFSEAKSWFERSIELQKSTDFCRLGLMHLKGNGVPHNEIEGFSLIKIAAEMELDFTQGHLGDCHRHGKGVDKNLDEALKWYLRSADQEDVTAMTCAAQTMLEIALKYGTVGMPGASPVHRTTHWLKKAVKLENKEAAGLLQKNKSSYGNLCVACDKDGTGTELCCCARCKITHYCSKECQTRHWRKGHKNDCVEQDL